MIGLVLAAQIADVVTFLAMVRVLGPDAEANPVVRTLLEGQIGFVLAAKAAVLAFALAVASFQRRQVQIILVAIIVAVSALGALSNLATIDASAPRPGSHAAFVVPSLESGARLPSLRSG